jgi:uncharacterized membrane protein YagU involved in acid resistance
VHDVKIITRGAVAGLVGTVVMTGAMLAAKKAGMAPGELAPRGITENVQEKLGVRDRVPKPAFEASWTVLHFGYGTASGVAYALLQEKAIGVDRAFLVGPLFGVLLWAIGYCGWLPVLGLYPPPTRLSKRKVGAELISTHLIYGAATAVAHRVLSTRSEP